MRRSALVLALAATCCWSISGAARADEMAQGDAEEETGAPSDAESSPAAQEAAVEEEEYAEEEEEEEEPGWVAIYADSVKTRALTGLNGLLTAPADPPMATWDPPKALERGGFARRPLGFGSGLLLMAYRTGTGAVDLGLAVMPGFPVVSPVPRYKLIPGFTHEDE